jgi:hypothetical protein
MNEDDFDEMIRQANPPVVISNQRLWQTIGAVFDRLDQPARPRFFAWPIAMPVLRFAVPMLVAVMLGAVVSNRYNDNWPVAQFSSVYLAPFLMTAGS